MFKLFFAMFMLFSQTVFAFELSGKTINVVIPFPPGGGVDMTFQSLKNYAATQNINLVAIYKPGAEGMIGMSELSKMPNDGLNVSVSTVSVVATYFKQRNQDILPLMGLSTSTSVLMVNSKSNIKTYTDFENLLKTDKNITLGYGAPGQKLILNHLLTLADAKTYSLIPFKGGGQVLIDLIGGHIDAAFLPTTIAMKHINSGELRALAIHGNKFSNDIKIPSMKTLYKDWKHSDWFCFVLPQNTDSRIQTAWTKFLIQYLTDSKILKEFDEKYIDTVPTDQESLKNAINFLLSLDK